MEFSDRCLCGRGAEVDWPVVSMALISVRPLVPWDVDAVGRWPLSIAVSLPSSPRPLNDSPVCFLKLGGILIVLFLKL